MFVTERNFGTGNLRSREYRLPVYISAPLDPGWWAGVPTWLYTPYTCVWRTFPTPTNKSPKPSLLRFCSVYTYNRVYSIPSSSAAEAKAAHSFCYLFGSINLCHCHLPYYRLNVYIYISVCFCVYVHGRNI